MGGRHGGNGVSTYVYTRKFGKDGMVDSIYHMFSTSFKKRSMPFSVSASSLIDFVVEIA